LPEKTASPSRVPSWRTRSRRVNPRRARSWRVSSMRVRSRQFRSRRVRSWQFRSWRARSRQFRSRRSSSRRVRSRLPPSRRSRSSRVPSRRFLSRRSSFSRTSSRRFRPSGEGNITVSPVTGMSLPSSVRMACGTKRSPEWAEAGAKAGRTARDIPAAMSSVLNQYLFMLSLLQALYYHNGASR
jgi:hypothetical protein